jgi:hypothetical protein
MGVMYAKGGRLIPEAHTHDGKTTIAGWIHGIYAVLGLWFILIFYFGRLSPQIAKEDFIFMAIMLTFFFPLGIIKFSSQWKFEKFAKWQVTIEIILLWAITYYKMR